MKPSRATTAFRWSKPQRGFTLLEVLIAFVLLSLTLGVILQIFSAGLRNVTAARHYAQATIIADSKLAMLGSALPLREGKNSGEMGIYNWRIIIQPHSEAEELAQAESNPYRLYSVTVQVRWQHGVQEPELEFTTYRLGAMDEL